MTDNKIKKAIQSLVNMTKMVTPIIIGVVLLVGLVNKGIPKSFFASIFTGLAPLDAFIGAIIGSVAAGNPITSYIIGHELLNNSVALVAVVAFIIAWVTVGLVQFPAESLMLGKKFAFWRNLTSFITAIIISLLSVGTLWLIL
ncbi:MAG: hypothetical protein U5L76_05250 [Patescibacteria group bacterium]|nr:hypothetical protein [Patescibacteria group bacterium]